MAVLRDTWADIEDWMIFHDALSVTESSEAALATMQIVLDAMFEEIAEIVQEQAGHTATAAPSQSLPHPELVGDDMQLLQRWLAFH